MIISSLNHSCVAVCVAPALFISSPNRCTVLHEINDDKTILKSHYSMPCLPDLIICCNATEHD